MTASSSPPRATTCALLPIIGGEVPWATSRPPGDTRNCLFPPKHNSDFAAFMRLVVQRYGPSGTLWNAHPELSGFALTRCELLDDLGAKKWKLHVTEFGWATSGPPEKPHTTDEARQARLVKNTITKLAAERDKLKLKSLDYYQWRDVPVAPGDYDCWGLHTGLLRLDGSPKPALNAVVKASRAIK
jgi:hypothetical protein